MTWLWVAVAALLVLTLLRRRFTLVQPIPGNKDEHVLEQLKAAGSNLELPTDIRHYLYFPQEASARHAEEVLTGRGFKVEVRMGADKKNWLALASRTEVPALETITAHRSSMEELAAANGGAYDGWEAAVMT